MNAMTPKNENYDWLEDALRALPTDIPNNGFSERVMNTLHADEKRRRSILAISGVGGLTGLLALGGWQVVGLVGDAFSKVPSVEMDPSSFSWESLQATAASLPTMTIVLIIVGLAGATMIFGEDV